MADLMTLSETHLPHKSIITSAMIIFAHNHAHIVVSETHHFISLREVFYTLTRFHWVQIISGQAVH